MGGGACHQTTTARTADQPYRGVRGTDYSAQLHAYHTVVAQSVGKIATSTHTLKTEVKAVKASYMHALLYLYWTSGRQILQLKYTLTSGTRQPRAYK